MTALTWLFLAGAAALSGGGALSAGSVPAPAPAPVPKPPRLVSERGLSWLAAGASAALCLAVLEPVTATLTALVAAPSAAAGVRWMSRRSPPSRADPALALGLDLVAVALRAGQPLPSALLLAAPAAGASGGSLARVGGLLRLGAGPAQAWAAVGDDDTLGPLAAAARRSAESGIRLAAAFEQRAVELRAERSAQAQARAHRVGVLVAAPLGLCFLPSFICLGIAPIIIGVAHTVLGG